MKLHALGILVSVLVWVSSDAAPPDIVLPNPPTPVTPPLPAVPTYNLAAGVLLDVVVNKPCDVLIGTPGVVQNHTRVVSDGKQLEKDGQYFDGSTTKTWTGPCTVYLFRADPNNPAGGTTSVFVVPRGYTESSQIKQFIIVTGKGPQPPPPVVPTDPLVKSLQAAYDLETDPGKAAQLANLKTTMTTIVSRLKDSGRVTSMLQLRDSVHANTDAEVGKDKLVKLRAAIGDYLMTKFGKENRTMTADLWTLAATEYATVADALGKLK